MSDLSMRLRRMCVIFSAIIFSYTSMCRTFVLTSLKTEHLNAKDKRTDSEKHNKDSEGASEGDELSESDFYDKEDEDSNNHGEANDGEEAWKVNMPFINSTSSGSTNANEKRNYFEGDIRLDPITRLRLEVEEGLHTRRKRAVKKARINNDDYRWKDGIIPYVISRKLPKATRKEIRKAIRHWMRKTCLKFRRKNDRDVDYIRFVNDRGCWSNVGRVGGEQKISIGRYCAYRGTIIHEIGHAVGMWHEQSRRDRDTYIRIIKDNIDRNQRDQFRRVPASYMDSMGYAYDYWSIMHYGANFFSRNGQPTIRIKKIGRLVGARIGQRKGLSYLDVAQVKAMYHCNKLPSAERKKGCFKSSDKDGRDYRGDLDYTEKGVTCQHWHTNWPHRHNENLSKNGLGEHNKCRNPDGKRDRPWCYTTLTKTEWQYCDITICKI